ncbi:MAG: YHYH protein [Actinomycetota bacterium]
MRRMTLHRTLALLLAGALVCSACGDDGEDDVASQEPSTTAVASEPDPADSDTESAPDIDAASDGEDVAIDDDAVAGDSTIAAVGSVYLDDYTLVDDTFGTEVTVTVADGTRTLISNSLPNHETGEFPNAGNPNEITEQSLDFSFTTTPEYTGAATFAQLPGVSINGVTFEPGTGESVTCTTGENYRIEALQDLFDLGLDVNNAHVQPGGQYHYHGVSQLMIEAFATDDDLVHVGFAADGFLIYYSKSGAYDSSYALSSDDRTGSTCTYRDGEIDLEGTTPDGTYVSDWVYTDGGGDLDECNGTEIDGTYAYVMTDEYPFISRCLMGDVSTADGGGFGAGGGGAPTGGAPPDAPDFGEAAATLGVTEQELIDALGSPPDVDAAAATLGIPVDELVAILPPPPDGAPA